MATRQQGYGIVQTGEWDGEPIWRELTAEDKIQAALLEVEKNRQEKRHE